MEFRRRLQNCQDRAGRSLRPWTYRRFGSEAPGRIDRIDRGNDHISSLRGAVYGIKQPVRVSKRVASSVVSRYPVTGSLRGMDDEILWLGCAVAVRADSIWADRSVAVDVAICAPGGRIQIVLVAPGYERPDRRPEPEALLREEVLVTPVWGRGLGQHIFTDQQCKAIRQHGLRNP